LLALREPEITISSIPGWLISVAPASAEGLFFAIGLARATALRLRLRLVKNARGNL